MDTSREVEVGLLRSRRGASPSIDAGTGLASQLDNDTGARRLLLLFGTVLCLSALTLCFRPTTQLENKPLTEDGYLLLSVSRNLAIGHGLSADGTHLTNGFQPLFTVIASLPYLVTDGNRVAGLRGVLGLYLLCYMATGLVVGLICRRMFKPGTRAYRVAAPLGAVCYLSASFVILTSFNGLETGVQLLVYALIWWYWATHDLQSITQQTILGALLGAAVLARVDSAFLVAVVTIYLACRRQIQAAMVAGVTAVVVSAPWWIYNIVLTGSLMPTSARAEHAWALSAFRVKGMVQAVSTDIMPWTYASQFNTSLAVALLRLGGAALVITFCLRLARTSAAGPDGAASGRVASVGRLIVAAAGGLIVWYPLYSFAYYFYARYLAPLTLVAVVGAVWLLLRAIGSRSVAVPVGIAAVLSIAAVVLFAALDIGKVPGNLMLTQQVSLVESLVPSGAAVAAGQSGTLSYFRDGVVNLDGKSNIDALSHAGDIPQYLESLGVRWICDEPGYLQRYLGTNPAAIGWHLVAVRGDFQLWHHT